MKKALTIAIVVLCIAVLPLSSFAIAWYKVTSQLEGLSDGDLLKLLEYVQKEIDGRESITPKVKVNPGQYLIGKDIPAGTYSVCDVLGKSYPDTMFYLYSSNCERIYYREVPTNGQLDNIVLSPGEIILITGNCVYFTPYEGLEFWD